MLFDKQFIDLGDVQAGTERKVSFLYKGDSPIEKIYKSCGCTSATREGNTITAVIKYGDKKRDYVKNITMTVQTKDKQVHILKVRAHVKSNNK